MTLYPLVKIVGFVSAHRVEDCSILVDAQRKSARVQIILRSFRDIFFWENMINLVVWIWQYQESETNKYRESRRQNKKKNILWFLALPKKQISLWPSAHFIFSSAYLLCLFFLIKNWKIQSPELNISLKKIYRVLMKKS